jgi:hypothetical protein
MIKTILIFREDADADRTAFAARIREAVVPKLLPFCPAGLKTSISDIPPPMLRVIPFRKDLIAVVSAEGASDQLVQKGSALKGYAGAFRVAEALPVSDEAHWPRNVPAPGIGLLTLFRKKQGLEEDAFLLRWFEGHTPLSLKLHPLTNYNRNRVIETLEGSRTSYDGIVEEHVREARDLLNPLRFFGHPPWTLVHMLRVLWDVRGFIDYPSIETWLVSETLYRSNAPPDSR